MDYSIEDKNSIRLIERIACANNLEFNRLIDETPSWARFISHDGSFYRLKPEYWERALESLFLEEIGGATSKVEQVG